MRIWSFKTGLVLALSIIFFTSSVSPIAVGNISNTKYIAQNTAVYTKPTNYAELVNWYKALEANYPNYLEVFKANKLYNTGTAIGGYDLYYVRITNKNLGLHKPEVLFLGSPHGDETVGTISLYWFTDWLMRMAFTDEPCPEYSKDWLRWIIDNREIYIEVSHNPYGFDHGPQRYDGHGWDLNREADYDGPGSPTGGIWGSVQGKTLRAFVDHHLVRVGCDFHGGSRMLLYPWADTHSNVVGTSPITRRSYNNAPPDFYYYDAEALRVGSYMGDYGGDLNKNNIGTIHGLIWYPVKGGIAPWAYAADVVKNPVEDSYVNDEINGNYPGAGILWLSPEMSNIKNPSENTFGSDTDHKYGAEVRRFVLHQTDLAQPYTQWQSGTIENNVEVDPGNPLTFKWQVNGCLVVDHTSIQWGTHPNPINYYDYETPDHNEHAGDYLGGTGWDNAEDGKTHGMTYSETITINSPGEYYFVTKAKVDTKYKSTLRPDIYGTDPYLRLVKERTDDTYYESLMGTDGHEEMQGQTWWYSPIIHVTVSGEPDLRYTPTSHNFGAMHEGQSASTNFDIWNEGTGKLSYTLNENCNWIELSSTSGESTGEHDPITIYINTAGLSNGHYSSDISINSNDESGTFTVEIDVVSEAILSFSPVSYDFGDMYQNQVSETTFQIQNVGDELLEYELTSEHDWVIVTPITGDSSGEADTINIEINTASLSLGAHICNISVESNAGNDVFRVTVNVIDEIPEIKITNPEIGYSYFRDKKSLKKFMFLRDRALIFGQITIDVDTNGFEVGRIEFYVDNELKGNVTEEPHGFMWNERTFRLHEIKVIVYDSNDVEVASDKIEIFIYNLGRKIT